MISEDIKEKYTAVEGLLENAVNNANSVDLVGEEENVELLAINSMLKELNTEFKQEIEKLEASSEWDKFCIAFFGETNAGKSTVIDSLRIIYDEEQRRLEKENQKKEYELALAEHCRRYRELTSALQEINDLIVVKKAPNRFIIAIKNIGLVSLGIIMGILIAYFGI